jgi:hydrogenase maturation protease
MQLSPGTQINRNDEVLIVGVGNSLGGDDAFGFYACERLKSSPPWRNPRIRIVFIGLNAFGILDHLHGGELLIILDAVQKEGVPGTVVVRNIDESTADDYPPLTSHEIGFSEVLQIGRRLTPDLMPRKTILLGVVGESFLTPCLTLSPGVEAALDRLPELLDSVMNQ